MQIIKELYAFGIIDLAEVLISPIISLIILFLTLRHDKKQFEVQIRNQEREHKETLQIMEQEHIQSLKQQSEINRIAAMPYLLLDKEISVYIEKDILYFALSFFNKGNGTAIELTGKYNEKLSNDLCPMCKTSWAIYGCACPFDYETSVVRPDNKCRFDLYQDIINEGMSKLNCDKVEFTILYKDMYFNQYEQTFMFWFWDNNENSQIEITRVSTCSPTLIKEISRRG